MTASEAGFFGFRYLPVRPYSPVLAGRANRAVPGQADWVSSGDLDEGVGRDRVKTTRNISVLLLFAFIVQFAHADDFAEGAEAYARGDYEAAFARWVVPASQGDLRAQYKLAQMFSQGIGVAQDERAALQWFLHAAEQGSVEARYDLALMYSLGRGTPTDYTQAAYWYGRLAEEGHATAQHLLAGMYEEGKGVVKDVPRAVFWYRRAAEQGYVESQAKLGRMYSEGYGVARDLVQAWVWFDLAAARGDDEAARTRTRIRLRLNQEELADAMELSRGLSRLPAAPAARSEASLELAAAPEMTRIESGCFSMGSVVGEPGRHENETPHAVCVDDFSIARFEVTRGQYAAFVGHSGHVELADCHVYRNAGWTPSAGRSWRDPGFEQTDEHPVACVSRDDAMAYARWLSQRQGRSYRLPTEAEWEYAARTGQRSARPWGDDPDQACRWANVGDRELHRHYPDWPWTIHSCDDGHVHTAPVGSFRANRYGLHDLMGNIWEWTCSAYDAQYGGAELRCASDAGGAIARGGSWSNSPRWVRSAGRFASRSDMRFDLVGFRLAHD